jgi:hypothetical protein
LPGIDPDYVTFELGSGWNRMTRNHQNPKRGHNPMTKQRRLPTVIALCAAAALMIGVLASPAQAALKHLDGTVAAKNAAAKTFRITTQSGRSVSFKVNSRTEFERIAGGFSGLAKGLAIEVDYVQTANGNVAKQVETQGGGGGDDNGGDDDGSHGGGNDDGPNHT